MTSTPPGDTREPDAPREVWLPLNTRWTWIAAAMVAIACDQPEQLWVGRAVMGPTPLVLASVKPFRAPGPTRELCLGPEGDRVRAELDSLVAPGPGRIQADVYLIALDGSRDRLGYYIDSARVLNPTPVVVILPESSYVRRDSVRYMRFRPQPPAVSIEYGGLLCIWDHGARNPERVYRAVEIRSDRPFPIREVRWWSGRRVGSL